MTASTAPTASDGAALPGTQPRKMGLLLISRGNTDPIGREAALSLAERVRHVSPDGLVASAFLTYSAPTVPTAFAELVASGAREIVAVLLFPHKERMVTSSIPRALLRVQRDYPGIFVRVAPSLEVVPELVHLVLAAAQRASDLTLRKNPTDEVDWAKRRAKIKPAPRERRAFVCTSTYCTEVGVTDLLARVKTKLETAGYGENAPPNPEMNVKVTRSACLSLCGLAPVMVVYPDGTWYGGFDAEQLDRIVDEHLLGGCPVAELACDTALPEARGAL